MSSRKHRVGPKRRHIDADKYVIYVLWVIGHSERSIAYVMGFRRKQIAGIIANSDFAGRSTMTDGERRSHLKDLLEIRFANGDALDGGRLDNIEWDLRPLEKTQLRGPLRRKMQ